MFRISKLSKDIKSKHCKLKHIIKSRFLEQKKKNNKYNF